MSTDIANTVSNLVGDGGNNENDAPLVNALPQPGTPRRRPRSSAADQLGPRTRRTEKDLDFAIYEDETAHEAQPPIREYYGSNVPTLADISSGKAHKYAPHHVRHRKYGRYAEAAARRGDAIARNEWRALQRDCDTVSLEQRATGCYEWVTACDPLDVCLWVQDKGYHRRWNATQRTVFVRFLDWMAPIVREDEDGWYDRPMMLAGEDPKAQLITATFEGLGIQNLTVKKHGLTVLFTPRGEDRHVIYRRDFTSEERRWIDVFWPELWAPGNERNLDEMVKEALRRIGLKG